jgi:hypothetical protein
MAAHPHSSSLLHSTAAALGLAGTAPLHSMMMVMAMPHAPTRAAPNTLKPAKATTAGTVTAADRSEGKERLGLGLGRWR